MKCFRLKQQDSYFGHHYVGFLTLPDEYQGVVADTVVNVGNLSSIGDAMIAIDEELGTGAWQIVQGLFYSGDDGNFSLSRYLAKHFYPVAKPVNNITETTTLYSTTKINGLTFAKTGRLEYQGSSAIYGYNLVQSVLFSSFELAHTSYLNYYFIKIQIPCLFESQIVDDKISLTTNDYVGNMYIELYHNQDETYSVMVTIRGNGLVDQVSADVLAGLEPEETIPDDDPWNDDDDPSDDDGGPGSDGDDNYSDDSDTNDIPDLPSLDATDTGFISLYTPTIAELKNLAAYLWGGIFDITTWKKVMADPMDAIIGLSMVPVVVPTAGSQAVTVGNIPTGISLTKAARQFVSFSCGTVVFDAKWKAYLDYSPYTKLSIYLPFIGSQEIDADLVVNTVIGVTYHIDILSGACVAFITVNGGVIMQFSGQCAVSIPITSQDFTQTIMSLGQLVASGIGVVATGGMSAPVQGAAIAGLATAAANTANNIIASKPTFAKTGNMSGSNGLMGVQKPYLFIERPRKCVPLHQNSYTGYPSYATKTLANLSGFTQVQDIHLNGIPCNDTERDEILRLLREGVIL